MKAYVGLFSVWLKLVGSTLEQLISILRIWDEARPVNQPVGFYHDSPDAVRCSLSRISSPTTPRPSTWSVGCYKYSPVSFTLVSLRVYRSRTQKTPLFCLPDSVAQSRPSSARDHRNLDPDWALACGWVLSPELTILTPKPPVRCLQLWI
jgi:hypothetical protein